jgi:hypothetical protein
MTRKNQGKPKNISGKRTKKIRKTHTKEDERTMRVKEWHLTSKWKFGKRLTRTPIKKSETNKEE